MNTSALDAYVKMIARAEKSLERLTQYMLDHGEVFPDDVTWAHVGTMAYIANELEDLKELIDETEG